MLGAVTGPLLAVLLIWAGFSMRGILLWTLLPGLAAAAAIFWLTSEHPASPAPPPAPAAAWRQIPTSFRFFLVGVFLFGLGDFSRTFLILLAARALGEQPAAGVLSLAVLLYALHNLVSAAAAYPVGHLGDRHPKLRVLVAGYSLGVAANLILAFRNGAVPWLAAAIVLSGVYIAVEETLEKAVAAELAPRELRSLAFGILACANSAGDMASSVYVGLLLEAGRPDRAFGVAAALGIVGVAWMWTFHRRISAPPASQR
jgi:MFS family permease